jgi:hypothetical protein
MNIGTSGAGADPFTTTITVQFGHTFNGVPVVVAVPQTMSVNTVTVWSVGSISTTGFTVKFTNTGSACSVAACPVGFYVHVIGY